MVESKIELLLQSVESGDTEKAKCYTKVLVDEGMEPQQIIDRALVPSMDNVGNMFSNNEIFVPEMLVAAQAMKESMKIIKPLFSKVDIDNKIKFVLGTVQGDLHDIGKNMVGMMMEGAGFEVIDLGVDVSPQNFVDAILENNAEVLGLSALLTTTMPKMNETIETITEAGLRDKIKIIVGGAPVSGDFAKDIGADGYGDDAGNAVIVVRNLLKKFYK